MNRLRTLVAGRLSNSAGVAMFMSGALMTQLANVIGTVAAWDALAPLSVYAAPEPRSVQPTSFLNHSAIATSSISPDAIPSITATASSTDTRSSREFRTRNRFKHPHASRLFPSRSGCFFAMRTAIPPPCQSSPDVALHHRNRPVEREVPNPTNRFEALERESMHRRP